MNQRLFLMVQNLFFRKHNIRNIFLILLIFFTPIIYCFNNKLTITILNNIANSDMFNVSGILAGFIFTSLSFIVVSDSKMIQALKDTRTFEIIKNFYVYGICSYASVMILYLLKPILMQDNSIFGTEITPYIIIIKIYLLVTLFFFIFGCILFLFCLFVLNKRINE